MPTIDPELWPAAVVVAIIAIGLIARWLRGSAVEDPERLADSLAEDEVALADEERVEHDAEAQVGEDELDDDLDDEDELAPLGVSPHDRLEFLERLAERGAVTLLVLPDDPTTGNPFVSQHEDEEGNVTVAVFTSERKALRSLRVLGRDAQSFEPWAVDAAFLVQGDFRVLVNPGTRFQTELSAEDRRVLADLAGVEEREPVDMSAFDDDVAERAADEDEAPPRRH